MQLTGCHPACLPACQVTCSCEPDLHTRCHVLVSLSVLAREQCKYHVDHENSNRKCLAVVEAIRMNWHNRTRRTCAPMPDGLPRRGRTNFHRSLSREEKCMGQLQKWGARQSTALHLCTCMVTLFRMCAFLQPTATSFVILVVRLVGDHSRCTCATTVDDQSLLSHNIES